MSLEKDIKNWRGKEWLQEEMSWNVEKEEGDGIEMVVSILAPLWPSQETQSVPEYDIQVWVDWFFCFS